MPSHGSNADFVGNGYVLSDYLNSASFSGSRDSAETTTFKKRSKTYIPGLKDNTMSVEGIYDGAVDAVEQVLQAAFDSQINGLFSYVPDGKEAYGNKTWTMDTIETSYEINTEIGDVAQITCEFSAGSAGQFTRGVIGLPHGVRASGGSGNTVDGFSAGSTDKGSLVVHCTAAASLNVKLQHSTDGSTWSDLPGSLAFNSRGSQRLSIPTQTINRYTRVLWTGTGTFTAIIER